MRIVDHGRRRYRHSETGTVPNRLVGGHTSLLGGLFRFHPTAPQEVLRVHAVRRHGDVPFGRESRMAVLDAVSDPDREFLANAESEGIDRRGRMAPGVRRLSCFALFRGPASGNTLAISDVRLSFDRYERIVVRVTVPGDQQVRLVDSRSCREGSLGGSYRSLPNVVNRER